MNDTTISVPEYARHLDEKTYRFWSKYWTGFPPHLPFLKTAEDAAAFLMIAAVEADEKTSKHFVYNPGPSIAPPAALVQYRLDVAIPGMEIALTQLFNIKVHGVQALGNLAQVAADNKKAIWGIATVSKFLDLLSECTTPDILRMINERPNLTPDIVTIADRHLISHPEDHLIRDRLLEKMCRIFDDIGNTDIKSQSFSQYVCVAFDRHAPDKKMEEYGLRLWTLMTTPSAPSKNLLEVLKAKTPRVYRLRFGS